MDKLKEQSSIFISCDCGVHGLMITEINEDTDECPWWEIEIIPYYIGGHDGDSLGWRDRIKAIFGILFRGKWCCRSWVLIDSPERGKEIADYFNAFVEKCPKRQYDRT